MAKPFAVEFYRSGAWKGQRKNALRRDMFTCADCGGRANEVHHIVELTAENINDMKIALGLDNLISLCHDCHGRRTIGKSDLPDGYFFGKDGQPIPPEGC